MILRLALFAALSATPVAAEELFRPGTVLCSNYNDRTRSCRTITTVVRVEDGKRYARSRRMVAMPDENLLLETEGVAWVEGNRVCGIGPTAEPRFSPVKSRYNPVLMQVYKDKRDKKLARGVCHEYRRCGEGWSVYVSYDDQPEARMVSWTRIFGPDDKGGLGLTLRYREFGISERPPRRCDVPLG